MIKPIGDDAHEPKRHTRRPASTQRGNGPTIRCHSTRLFGSVARDEGGTDSDIDVLVRFDGPATSKRYFGVQFYLEDLLGRPVDLVTDKALRPELRPFIEREAIHV